MIDFIGYPGWGGMKEGELREWLRAIARCYGRSIKMLSYLFVDDREIVVVNRRYLNHDYPTDIITFGYDEGVRVAGEVYIGVDTVCRNAERFQTGKQDELDRVIAHGLLHLCGFDDGTDEERAVMRKEEEKCLLLRPKILGDN